MMDFTAEQRAQFEAELAERRAAIDAQVAVCPACKAAKTRKAKAAAQGNMHKADTCSRHGERYRLLWVTSPLSETYWCS